MGRRSRKKHEYSSRHQILLVGEGDFSFALCLARRFGSAASSITATSLDTRDKLESNYRQAMANVEELQERGCKVIHGVNVHSMNQHRLLRSEVFDRIVFNFPHAGFHDLTRETDSRTISRHQQLVRGFFRSASEMVWSSGEIHVTHKASYPFAEWDLENLAEQGGLYLVKEVPFCKDDYPSYNNKKGSGVRCDSAFPIGDAVTFKFKTSTLR